MIKISIHAAREGGDEYAKNERRRSRISIHAAREGGDCLLCILSVLCYISIHAAREGGDRENGDFGSNSNDFNPRRP